MSGARPYEGEEEEAEEREFEEESGEEPVLTGTPLASCSTAVLQGIEPVPVAVEVVTTGGLPGIRLVGLPSPSVKESEERVRSALRRSGFRVPRKRFIVNLAPADVRKEGSALDLPIALAILSAVGIIPCEKLRSWCVCGELALDGRLRGISGALNYAAAAEDLGRRLLLPAEVAEEAALVPSVKVYGAETLREAVEIILGNEGCPVAQPELPEAGEDEVDFQEVRGQKAACRAAVAAAAGGHNLLMIGPPGSGKTMIARRIPTILPPLSGNAVIEKIRIHSVAGLTRRGLSRLPPFRAPHHSVSVPGLVGGGNPLRPGEVSLAHRGVLFLDELPEFRRELLESLRMPLEDGFVTVTRARMTAVFPSRVMLVAAMNPCPCGFAGSDRPCRCSPGEVERYRRRLSGPLLDRIDIQVTVPRRSYDETSGGAPGISSARYRAQVLEARQRQASRYRRCREKTNATVAARSFKRYAALTSAARRLLRDAVDRVGLSARGADRVERVARTLADLAASAEVKEEHIAEAVRFRTLELPL